MLKNSKLLRLSLVWLAAVSACHKAAPVDEPFPNVNVCFVTRDGYMCDDGGPKDPKGFENWACLSAADEKRSLEDCKQGRGTKVNFCVVMADGVQAICADESKVDLIDGKYACLSPHDTEIVIKYCRRKG